MASVIVPVAKPLCLCDDVSISSSGKVDVRGVFNSIRATWFPCLHPRLTVFAQLYQGLGDVRTVVDIRRVSDGRLVHTSSTAIVSFQSRTQTRYLVLHMPNIVFDQPEVYLAELLCDNTWVADVSFELRGGTP